MIRHCHKAALQNARCSNEQARGSRVKGKLECEPASGKNIERNQTLKGTHPPLGNSRECDYKSTNVKYEGKHYCIEWFV